MVLLFMFSRTQSKLAIYKWTAWISDWVIGGSDQLDVIYIEKHIPCSTFPSCSFFFP